MDNVYIRGAHSQYNSAGWMLEKSGAVLESLCVMLSKNEKLADEDCFYDALWNALKIYAFCNGKTCGLTDQRVFDLLKLYNVEGYEFLKDLLCGTKISGIMQKIMEEERENTILEVIERNDRLCRPELAEMLEKADDRNKWICRLKDDLECVHNGEKAWDWFYCRHCNDRHTFQPVFEDQFIHRVFDYFRSNEFIEAD